MMLSKSKAKNNFRLRAAISWSQLGFVGAGGTGPQMLAVRRGAEMPINAAMMSFLESEAISDAPLWEAFSPRFARPVYHMGSGGHFLHRSSPGAAPSAVP